MRSTSTSSHADDRPPPNRLVVIVVGTLLGGICFGAIVDRALWATEQANKPQAIVTCPAVACPACPTCPTCPTLPPAATCPDINVCPSCPTCALTCPERGAPLPLAGTLWTVSSAGWDGYVDFRGDGVYWTHWLRKMAAA